MMPCHQLLNKREEKDRENGKWKIMYFKILLTTFQFNFILFLFYYFHFSLTTMSEKIIKIKLNFFLGGWETVENKNKIYLYNTFI